MLQGQLSRIGNSKICPVAIILKEGRVLMGLRHYTPDKWKAVSVWTCPGGRCEDGETIEIALRREVQEETGISDLEIQEYMGEVPGAKEGDVVPLFLCKTIQEERNMEPQKFSDWRWYSFEDFPKDYINSYTRTIILDLLKRIQE